MNREDSFLEKTKREIIDFCREREWDQFHTPKDLAIGLVTESSELLELFRFATEEQVKEKMKNSEFRSQLSDELADVLFFLVRFAQKNEIDLEHAFSEKMKKNREKYPAEIARGKNLKYTEYDQN